MPLRPATLGRWLTAALLVGLIAGFYLLGGHHYLSWDAIRSHRDAWQADVDDNLLLSLSVFFVVYVAVTALSLPVAVVLTLVGGALFGLWLGTAVISLASTLGAALAFLLSRYLLGGWVQRRFGDRLRTINQEVERDGAYYLFTLRLAPVVPFWLINLGMALTPMRLSTYVAVSWLGMLPGTVLYVNFGTALASIESPAGLLSPGVIVSLLLLGVAPLALRKAVARE